MKSTITILHTIYRAAETKGSRSPLDFFADRMRQATTEPTLLAAMERLQQLMAAPPSRINATALTNFIAEASGPTGPRVLEWLRRFPRVAAMLAGMAPGEDRDEALSLIELPEISASGGVVPARRPFDIGISASLMAPLAHGSDGKSGNATIFRRQQVQTSSGLAELPFFAGNALRGILRDLLADHFLTAMGIPARRDQPSLELWFFHTLYAGGSLEEGSKAQKALNSRFGAAAGSLNSNGVREFRDMLPALSLLGCALGNRVMAGRVQVADLRPRCREWGTGDAPVSEMMTWEFLTRRDDHEGRGQDDGHAGMIAQTECLRPGVSLDGGIDMDSHIQNLERAALGRGLALLASRGYLGAESRRGFGRADFVLENAPDPAPYDDFLASRAGDIRTYLRDLGVLIETAPADGASKPADPATDIA